MHTLLLRSLNMRSVYFLCAVTLAGASCPHLQKQSEAIGSAETANIHRKLQGGGGRVPSAGFKAVQADLELLMKDSKEFWPADFDPPTGPHYGGLFIRLAWHCAGSYRAHDGRGGCDGGRIRFSPELTWPDNANLDKALELLKPVKEKYGDDLSWGDLIILSGNAAISSMGGKLLGFCGGRIDDDDGSKSLILGPSDEQEAIGPCQSLGLQGKCLTVNGTALGPTTVGLIYVNPAGPVGEEGNPIASGRDIRTAFGRMGFDDTESVALIGGGHAFGKMHGACSRPPCGDGKGKNAFTSGFEGSWTTIPTTWSNQYFTSLFNFNWKTGIGPGGNLQWSPFNPDGSKGPDIVMLTTDIAMATDPAYADISRQFEEDLGLLETEFAKAWYRLTSADMGPPDRCIGDLVPEPQPFQSPLPPPPATLPNFIPVRSSIQDLINSDPANVNAFINLAYRCASTWRDTDYKGGCNGARIRFPPESTWVENAGTDAALATLKVVKDRFPIVSYADLIVLAGQTALEHSTGIELAFCGGRVDAADAANSAELKPRFYDPAVVMVTDDFKVKGLSTKQGVALAAREQLTPSFFSDLLAASPGDPKFTREELALKEGDLLALTTEFSTNKDALTSAFKEAWTFLMTADRFDGNSKNACDGVNTPTKGSCPRCRLFCFRGPDRCCTNRRRLAARCTCGC